MSLNGWFKLQCLWHKVKGCCVSGPFVEGFLLLVAHDAWPLPVFVTAGGVLCFLPSPWQQQCMLLCWCLSTAKVSPSMGIMDLPVRFSVGFRVPQQSWTAGSCHCSSQHVRAEAASRWDMVHNGCSVSVLYVSELCSCGPEDAWSNRDAQRLWLRLATAHSPQSAMLPTSFTFFCRSQSLPSQPFTYLTFFAMKYHGGSVKKEFCTSLDFFVCDWLLF